ncbi:MAG: hypothetical protein ACTSU5_09015 [Promethearchaeota archaeon]
MVDWRQLKERAEEGAEEKSKKKAKKKATTRPSPGKPRRSSPSKAQKEIVALKSKVEELERRVEEVQKAKPHDARGEIIEKLSAFNFDDAERLILEAYSLEKFAARTVAGQNFFWRAANYKAEPEIAGDHQKLTAARLINRIHRGDSKLFEMFFSNLKKYFISLLGRGN